MTANVSLPGDWIKLMQNSNASIQNGELENMIYNINYKINVIAKSSRIDGIMQMKNDETFQ